MLLLSKIVPLFVYPLGLSISLVVFAGILAIFKRKRLAVFSVFTGVVLLWLASTPMAASWLNLSLQQQFPPLAVDKLQERDCAILLGGIVGQVLPPRVVPELSESVDRIIMAVRIFKAGKVKKIVVAAGNLPWSTAVQPEAVLIRDLLVEWGVPQEAVLLDSASRNTWENAVNSKQIMAKEGLNSAWLITSASHMGRALGVFHKLGVNVYPAAVDIDVAESIDSIFAWLPDASALQKSTRAMKESIGTVVYRLRGWI